MKKFIAIYIVLFIGVLLSSLNAAVPSPRDSWPVTDSEGEPIPYAIVTVIPADGEMQNNSGPDDFDSLIEIECDSTGMFVMPVLPDGQYHTDISGFGYNQRSIKFVVAEGKPNLTEDDFVLTKIMEADIDAVVVEYEKPKLKREGNKFVIPNISSSPFAQGQNTMELLKYTPLIRVDQDNKITLPGDKNATIYINDRPSNMSQEAIEAYLKGLPASDLEKIEIMLSPGSRYGSTGGGIINIVVKKRSDEGIRVNVSANVGVNNSKWRESGSASVDYSSGKWRINSGINASHSEYKNKSMTDYEYPLENRYAHTKSIGISKYQNYGTFFNLDYDVAANHTIGARLNFNIPVSKPSSRIEERYGRHGMQEPDSIASGSFKATNPDPGYYASANLNYTFKTDDRGSKLMADVYYIGRYRKTKNTNKYYTTYNDATVAESYTDYVQRDDQDMTGYSGKLTYEHHFNDANSIETGIDFDYGRTFSSLRHRNRKNIREPEYIPDPSISNDFRYTDFTAAAYFVYSRNWSDDLSTEIGLRYEWNRGKGHQLTTGERVRRTFSDFMPSFSINWDAADDHELSVDFAVETYRPSYYNYNTFKRYSSPSHYYQGNPYVRPLKEYAVDFSYRFFDDFTFLIRYEYNQHDWNSVTIPDENGEIRSTTYNTGFYHYLPFTLEVWKEVINKRLTLTGEFSVSYTGCRGSFENINMDSDDWSFDYKIKANAVLSEPLGLSTNLAYAYYGKNRWGTWYGNSIHLIDCSLMKKFKNGNLQFSYSMFLPRTRKTKDIMPELEIYGFYKNYSTFRLSYSHTFGNTSTKQTSRRSGSKIDSRLN